MAGNWESASVWNTQQVPVNPDTIIVRHYIVINQDLTIASPTVLWIDAAGTICGDYLLQTLCGASFINYGHMYLNRIQTRAGTNYKSIECKTSVVLSGCATGGSYFNTLPPNGTVKVWPPVLCKTIDTNWEGGTSIGLTELENAALKIYPNPIGNEPLSIITLSNTTLRLTDCFGKEIEYKSFENQTELNLSNLQEGLYFLELEIDGRKFLKKIIRSN